MILKMSDSKTRVIGYISFVDRINLFCSEDACVVAGSEKSILEYIRRANPGRKNDLNIKKARYGEIEAGLLAGGAYAFDKESYQRFQPIAIQEGYDLSNLNFGEDFNQEDDLLIICLKDQ
jgi:hypothetical protein